MSVRLGGTFDFEAKRERLEEVSRELESPSVWETPERAQALGKERADLDKVVNALSVLDSGLEEANELLQMAREDADGATAGAVQDDLEKHESSVV